MYGTNSPFGLGDPIFDSVALSDEREKPSVIDEQVLDAAMDDFEKKQLRANGMAAALTWLEENSTDYETFEAIVAGLADIDEDGDITEPEEQLFNDILSEAADALVELGADPTNVENFISNEASGEKLHMHLNDKLAENPSSDDEIISEFAVKSTLVMDAMQKVVRGGKVKLIRKSIRKKRLSAAQKSALKKARRKANNSAARRNRAKSMKVRQQRGI